MAVLAALQRAALGDVGADVIQRYYAAASTTPALVFGRLVRTAQFHLGKVKQEGPGLAWWYEERIAGVCTRIGKSMPATLTLEEQSMFALGYYQQLAALRTPKENEAKEGEK
jgi:CRISPR-associated protein Csd1